MIELRPRPRGFHAHVFLCLAFASSLIGSITRVAAKPVDYFPINSQLPPVARISEPFSFTFAPQTFGSDLEMKYSLASGPSWLALDSGTRHLHGTPEKDDLDAGDGDVVIGVPVSIVATDATGSTAANSTLVVSRNEAPRVNKPLEEQIPEFGPYSAPSSILLYPSHDFSFSFAQDTFVADGDQSGEGDNGAGNGDKKKRWNMGRRQQRRSSQQQLSYYAVSGDNAPLPSWVTFDATTLSFSGSTPDFASLVQPPQTFDFHLVASDVVGFSSALVPFSIVVGSHKLTATEPVIELKADREKPFHYDDLPKVLKIDKKPLTAKDLTSISAHDLPSWLEFDKESWKLSGVPDKKVESTNITIAVVDKFLDTLNVTLAIDFDHKIFVSDLPGLKVTAGKNFTMDLKRYLFNPMDTDIKIQTEPNAPWVQLDTSSLTLSGTAPKSPSENDVRVTLEAMLRRTKDTESKALGIQIMSATKPGEPAPTHTSQPKEDPGEESKRNLLWLLIIPILLIMVGIFLLLFCLRRRRQRRARNFLADVNGMTVSAPVPGSFVANTGSAAGSLQDMRKMLDIGPVGDSDDHVPAVPSNLRSSLFTSPEPVMRGTQEPHALTTAGMIMHSGAVKTNNNGIPEAHDSWLDGQMGIALPFLRPGTDETSLLSDTSLGEGEAHANIEEAQLAATSHSPPDGPYRDTSHTSSNKMHLEVPIISEPFSIQPTPDLAYTAGRKYEYSSDEEVPPTIGYSRPRSGQRLDTGLGLAGVGHRLSKALKNSNRTSRFFEDFKRNSNLSTSTAVTTRTSILTSGVAEEATTTNTHLVAKPTVIHIPSRPGEARQVSRRVNESTALFGGRSLMTSPRNFGLKGEVSTISVVSDETPLPPPIFKDSPNDSRDSDTSWDRLARNSLGIAYKDLMQRGDPSAQKSFLATRGAPAQQPQQTANWRLHHTTQDLTAADDQWPAAAPESPFVGIALTSTDADAQQRSRSEPPQLPPLTPSKPKGHTRQRAQALKDFRAIPPPPPAPEEEEWRRRRPLPETPTRTPLGDRAANAGSGGLRTAASKRSQRTVRSARSFWTANDDDEDAWEDVPPPESTVGGWDDEDAASERSFSVYI
ncbi:hypothetical protein F4780DRAFT_780650 [Xylariomycetidae sp. FL0641]|nr:hypothetical protein F4780DRAFT_780650 [Xylariomycetidae sp. FL0641]